LIQAGIVEVVYAGKNSVPERWDEDFTRSTNMMKEAGINLRNVEFE
jgi:deoxycytidylate deaminase